MHHPARGSHWSRFVTITRPFFLTEARWPALLLLGIILAFIFCLGGLNVLSNFMNRDFMTAVEQRHGDLAVRLALSWAAVFAALTVVSVLKAFTEERLRLRWREGLTRHLIDRYLSGRAYQRMKARADVDNPDQRITEDVKTFTEQALALLLIFTNSTITLISFSGILWSITPWLFGAAVLYAAFGSVMTVLLGRRLVKLDVRQYKKEADLRYNLIQVRTHAEPIALLAGERDEGSRLGRGLGAVVENVKSIIGLSRNISFFTTGYDYLTQLVPLVIVAPLYVRGEVEFGAVTQAQMAFFLVMGAFSVIVKEFQRISTFGAVVERLGSFYEVLEQTPPGPDKPPIETVEDATRFAFEGLTLVTPRDGRLLIKDLSVQVPAGRRLLVVGPSGSGRTALLRAAAGLWTAGQGRITRPPRDDVVFLPQTPYLRPGPLREQFTYATGKGDLTDERILDALRKVRFDAVLERVGGLDAEQDWPNTLSLGEQQLVTFARLLLANPPFAFLDEATSALDDASAHRLYEALAESPMTYVSVATDADLRRHHDLVIELGGTPEGAWKAVPVALAASA
jgi:putative ATP-binding cassette transporter